MSRFDLIMGAVIILCLTFATSAMAAQPTIHISTNKLWVVANGTDSDQVTVTIFNGTIPINGSIVAFSVNNPDFGFINPSSPLTTVNGSATANFMTNTKNGNATISATIQYKMNDTAPIENATVSTIQRIDHDTPYKISSYSLKSEGTVGTVDRIIVWVQDAHNNPVDNKREVSENRTPESVVFSITGQPQPPQPVPSLYIPANFATEGNSTVTRYVNESGGVEADLVLATIPGTHNVMATAMFPTQISRKWTIDSQADGDPWYIDCQIFPFAEPNPYLPADDASQFTMIYSLYDRYMNGLQAKTIDVTTSLDQSFTFGTNATGQQVFTYGPSPVVALVDLQATARDNLSVTRVDTVQFVNTTAANMIFTATPLSLPSADVLPAPPRISTLSAHVIDIEGNPVQGQLVQFTIPNSSIRYGGSNYTALYPPWLKNDTSTTNVTTVTAISDSTGIATVYLTPCLFNSNKSDTNGHPPYVASATGYCSVIATWTAEDGTVITDQQDFEFKNYPYLSARTSLSENEIPVNGTVDVTLYLSGDGFALLPTPIDVQMVCDKSGSMAENMAGTQNVNPPNRRWDAENASAWVFISKMNVSTDRLGLTLFDSQPTGVTNHLGTSFTTIQNNIKNAVPNGNTGTRAALKYAIDDMAAYPNSNSNAIRAIILMTDGQFNNYGDPLARGKGYDSSHTDSNGQYYTGSNWGDGQTSEHTYFSGLGGQRGQSMPINFNVNTSQNMTLYAMSKNLRVYTISLSSQYGPGTTIWNTLDTLSNCTGGKHYQATTASQLTDVYTQIAGELKNKAGVNTTSNLSFQDIEVKNVTVPGAEAFKYIPVTNVSTHVENWNSTGYHDYWINQSSLWDAYHTFSFNAGTIYIGDYWRVTFRLQALLDGDIHVFDPSSVITFNNDGTQTMSLPDTILKVIPNATNESGSAGNFTETDVNVTALTNTSYEWQWNRQYTGNQQVSEFYFISFDGGQQWTLIGDKTLSPEDARNQTVGSFIYDVRNLLSPAQIAAGISIDFKIKAFAQDAPSPRTPRSPPIIKNMSIQQQYITLQ